MSDLPPGKNLVFLMHDVSRLFRRRIDQRAQALDLTSAQWRVLASVARSEQTGEEPLNQASLADKMDMEPITLSRHIDRMQAAGLIERRPDPADRRAYRLHLTEAARPLVDKFRAIASQSLGEVLSGVDDKEVLVVIDVLTRMRANMVEKPVEAGPVEEQKSPKKIAAAGRIA